MCPVQLCIEQHCVCSTHASPKRTQQLMDLLLIQASPLSIQSGSASSGHSPLLDPTKTRGDLDGDLSLARQSKLAFWVVCVMQQNCKWHNLASIWLQHFLSCLLSSGEPTRKLPGKSLRRLFAGILILASERDTERRPGPKGKPSSLQLWGTERRETF